MIRQTAREALARWDGGEEIPAIHVESQGSSQEAIYACAFEILRLWGRDEAPTMDELRALGPELSDREFNAAHSIAHVAATKGWSVMMEQHRHPSIAEIKVKKPEAVAKT